ncbi:MAG: DUF935 family protein [Spirochaetota bacterium]
MSKNTKAKTPEDHIASLQQSRDFWHYHQNGLPNANRVLRAIGWDVGRLKEFILEDIQVQTTWAGTRLSFLTQTPWQIESADKSIKARKAAQSFRENLKLLALHRIMEQLLDCVSLGYSVAEILWQSEGSNWNITDIVPKPSQWFRFNTEGELLFLSKNNREGEVMPQPNFLVLKHRATYGSPYGESLFSKLYWPVLFKKHGLEWWVKFVERFGSLSYFGKYDLTATQQQQNELLQALLDMLSGSVAIGPENTSIVPLGDNQRWQGSTIHKDFADWLDKSIAKAVLGQNLSSDSGEKGSQALGGIQFRVLEAIAKSDQRIIASALGKLSRRYTDYNFGTEVPAPLFSFEQPEDLKKERAERDAKLYAIGWRPEAEYIEQNYSIPQEHFTLETSTTENPRNFSQNLRSSAQSADYIFSEHPEDDPQEQFANQLAGAGQEILDDIGDHYFAALEKQTDFEGAFNALSKARKRQGKHYGKLAGIIDNLRHVSRNIGSDDATS